MATTQRQKAIGEAGENEKPKIPALEGSQGNQKSGKTLLQPRSCLLKVQPAEYAVHQPQLARLQL